jgi:hypothetical protein
MPLVLWALSLSIAAAPRAIEIEFPQQVELPLARTTPLKPLVLKARWAEDAQGPELNAWVSFGEVKAWRRDGAGSFSGEWYPPDPAHPGDLQIVISTLIGQRIISSAQTSAVSAEIELRGKSEPDAEVEILLGGETFGPVRAQHDGRFTLLVTVPPGAQAAVARSKDRLGNLAKKSIDLFVPVVSRLALVCPVRRVQAGGAAITVQVANGKETTQFKPPEVIDRAQVPLVMKSGKLGSATCLVDVEPQRAAKAFVFWDPPFIVSDGADKTTLSLRVTDRFGNTTGDALVTAKEGNAEAAPLTWVEAKGRFELAIVSRREIEERRFDIEVRAVARSCKTSAVGAGATPGERDYRGIPCTPEKAPTLLVQAVLQQIPDRGVRLSATRKDNLIVIRLSPAQEADALQASDQNGKLGEITKAPDGTFTVPLKGLEGDVLVSHISSGTSVLVKR